MKSKNIEKRRKRKGGEKKKREKTSENNQKKEIEKNSKDKTQKLKICFFKAISQHVNTPFDFLAFLNCMEAKGAALVACLSFSESLDPTTF